MAMLGLAGSLFAQQPLPGAQLAAQKTAPFRHQSAEPMLTGIDGSQTGNANFLGNFTEFGDTLPNLFLLQRQADCSLNYITGTASPNGPSVSLTFTGNVPHYELMLHQLASLNTTPDVYPLGCAEPGTGISSRPGVYVAMPQGGIKVSATVLPNGSSAAEVQTRIYSSPYTSGAGTIESSLSNASTLATADLNGDGIGDLVIVNGNFAASSYISVMLGNSNGTFQSPVSYSTAGNYTVSAVIDDVNGDGKLDIVAVSADQQISVLLGNGDGTFQSALSFAAPALPGFSSAAATPIVNLITADLRGNGKKDVICSNGLVLLGNGDGTFTPVSTPAFPYFLDPLYSQGPNLASGDVNKDGKIDLVLDNSSTISIWTGNGDGTFTEGNSYSTITNIGYITVTDLDGDGNLDIYSGLASGGVYSGDQSDYSSAYVLMGNGDGTFQGALQLGSGAYTGNNLADVTGSGTLDLITSNIGGTFTVQLGTGKGTFSPVSTITAPASFVLNAENTLTGAIAASTYAVADINGDGKADLVFIGNFATDVYTPGAGFGRFSGFFYFVALSNGDGTFQTPVPYVFPQIGNPETSVDVTGLQIADFNHDGKNDLILTYNDQDLFEPVNPYNQGFVVLPGNGDGTFGAPIITSTYSGTSNLNSPPVIAAIADLNGDGNPDLVVINNTYVFGVGPASTVEVFLGNGDGTFKAPATVTTPANPTNLILSDFNKDGKLDIAVVCGAINAPVDQLAVALGNGDGTFASPTILTVSSDIGGVANLAAADFNGDLNVDLALFNEFGYSGIFYGNGDGTFTSVNTGSFVVPKDLFNIQVSGPAVAVDLNGDGKPDILVGNTILLNQGTSIASTLTTPTVTVTPSPTSFTTAQLTMVTVAVSGGSGGATPTGSVTLSGGGYTSAATTLASGSAVITVPAGALATGSDTLTATYTPDSTSSSVYNSATGTNSVTVTAALTPTFALSNGGNINIEASAATGNTSTITVTPANGLIGAVNLTCALTTIPTGAISPATCGVTSSVTINGTTAQAATLTVTTTSTTTAGAYAVTVTGIAGAITQTTAVGVTVAAFVPPTFALTNGGAITISSPGTTTGNTATITVTPSGSFTGSVALTAAIATSPAGATDLPTFSFGATTPVSITGASAGTGTLTVTTTAATTAALARPKSNGAPWYAAGGATLACLLFIGIPVRRRRWRTMLGMLVLLAFLTGAIVSCGGSSGGSGGGTSNPGTTTGSYTITVTGTSGSITQTTTVNLTVN